MAWVEVRFTVMGETQVARAFEAAERDSRDLSDPLERIAEHLRLGVSEQFRTEGLHGLGSKWKALDTNYARWKRQQVGEEPMLVFSGLMRETVTSRRAFTVTPQRLVYRPLGPHDDVAAYHQGGAGDLPQRKIVAITQAEKRTWEREFLMWLRRDWLTR